MYRVAALLLGMVLAVSVVFGTRTVPEVRADDEKKISGLGTGTIGSPEVSTNKDTPWSGNYVYYGNYNGKLVKYRVLDPKTNIFGGNTMLLDCDSILLSLQFNSTQNNNWANSDVKRFLNGNDFLEDSFYFTNIEKNAIFESSVSERNFKTFVKESIKSGFENGKYTTLNKDKIFLLDVEDVLNPAYGYSSDSGWMENTNWDRSHVVDNHKKSGENIYPWWLRSSYSCNDNCAGLVFDDGLVRYNYVFVDDIGVSPAFNVNLESVIFSSEITPDSGEYKLTLLDNDIKIGIPEGKYVTKDGNT